MPDLCSLAAIFVKQKLGVPGAEPNPGAGIPLESV